MSGLGHNGGPSMEPGFGFRKVAWKKARAALLPQVPLEILRVRVARAERLGLPYKTYASIRAASGRDVVAFLFSSNALALPPRMTDAPEVPLPEAARLGALQGAVTRMAAVAAPRVAEHVLAANPGLLEHAGRAPNPLAGWAETRLSLGHMVETAKVPKDGVVLITDAALEADWVTAAGLAGRVPASTFFARLGDSTL